MNPERLLENNALPFAAALTVDDAEGVECAVVVSRLAWKIEKNGDVSLAADRPIRIEKEYVRGPGSSIQFPNDEVTEKPGTDVMMIAAAWPQEKNATSMDVTLSVASSSARLHKTVRVFGRRLFEKSLANVKIGAAKPLTGPVPLVYELARGGVDPAAEFEPGGRDERNPVGRGHRLEANRDTLIATEAHRIEIVGGSEPAGFLPISPNWSPRRELYGTMDEQYFQERYPTAPESFDIRHNSDAHPDLWSPTPLRGNERVSIMGAVPEGAWSFQLPLYEPRYDVCLDGTWTRLPTKLDSMLIDLTDPDHDRVVELTWRCHVRLPKKSERLDKIRVTNEIDVPRRFYDDLLHTSSEPTEKAS